MPSPEAFAKLPVYPPHISTCQAIYHHRPYYRAPSYTPCSRASKYKTHLSRSTITSFRNSLYYASYSPSTTSRPANPSSATSMSRRIRCRAFGRRCGHHTDRRRAITITSSIYDREAMTIQQLKAVAPAILRPYYL